ncbi:MAG TPA: hypothetical protein ENJ66_04920, partial [Calditrichae bacterium]|nr:hypothetical protein [Calditrichia bacterium]
MTNRSFYIRKIIHVIWGSGVLFLLYALPRHTVWLLGVWAAGMTIADVLRFSWHSWQRLFYRLFDALLKPRERRQFPTGATLLVYTAFLLAALFPQSVAICAMSILTFGDALAAVVGKIMPVWRFPNGKSLMGSVAFFLVALGIYSHYFNLLMGRAVLAALVVTIIEAGTPAIA